MPAACKQGAAIAERFARERASLILVARSADQLQEVRHSLAGPGPSPPDHVCRTIMLSHSWLRVVRDLSWLHHASVPRLAGARYRLVASHLIRVLAESCTQVASVCKEKGAQATEVVAADLATSAGTDHVRCTHWLGPPRSSLHHVASRHCQLDIMRRAPRAARHLAFAVHTCVHTTAHADLTLHHPMALSSHEHDACRAAMQF